MNMDNKNIYIEGLQKGHDSGYKQGYRRAMQDMLQVFADARYISSKHDMPSDRNMTDQILYLISESLKYEDQEHLRLNYNGMTGEFDAELFLKDGRIAHIG